VLTFPADHAELEIDTPSLFQHHKHTLEHKMKFVRLAALAGVIFLPACATSDHVSLVAGADQQSLTRNGVPAFRKRSTW
jgi:hypothetical protein